MLLGVGMGLRLPHWGVQIKDNEIGVVCCTHGTEEKYLQSFSLKTLRKKTYNTLA
jgi:hypothetical protein